MDGSDEIARFFTSSDIIELAALLEGWYTATAYLGIAKTARVVNDFKNFSSEVRELMFYPTLDVSRFLHSCTQRILLCCTNPLAPH
jgi:hypothetical protein